jgi:putative glycosyltransferase (TIGR04372 family)
MKIMKIIFEKFEWWTFTASRVKTQKFHTIIIKLISKIISYLLFLIAFPIVILLYFFDYRFVKILGNRIGHLALEPEYVYFYCKHYNIPLNKVFLYFSGEEVANKHLLTYWSKLFCITNSKKWVFLFNSLSNFGILDIPARKTINSINRIPNYLEAHFNINSNDIKTPPLSLTSDDAQWGEMELAKIGIPKGAWFVCIHAREGGYSSIDESIQKHRNSTPALLMPAIHEIIKNGGYVVRLGDPSMKKLQNHHKLIDYAHHPMRSDRLDLILCAKAKFFFGNTSGIWALSSIFKVPCITCNVIPYSLLKFNRWHQAIAKPIKEISTGNYLSSYDISKLGLEMTSSPKIYKNLLLSIEENTSLEIENLAKSALQLLVH